MPTYEYVCSKCGHEFEKFQPIADKPLSKCPKNLCGQKAWGKGTVKRKIGAGAGLIFKGTGFYITDYRSDSYREGARKESAASKPAPAGDSKPAASDTRKTAAKPTAKPGRSKPAS
jgi:putative FmdB family regulatory protein